MQIEQDITLPEDPPSSRDRANFRLRADTFVTWIKTFATQISGFITQLNSALTWINEKEASTVSAALVAVSATNFQGIWTNQMTEEKQSWLFSGVVYMVLIPGNTSPTASPQNWKALPNIKTVNGFSADSVGNINVEDRIGTPIASASTITIGTEGLGDTIHITGTTTITSLGIASQNGVMRTLVFDGIMTLTHNVTSLILLDGTSITTAVGDSAEFVCENAVNGYWRLLRYTRAISSSGFVAGSFSNLKVSSTGLSANVSITADEIVVKNQNNLYNTLRSVSLTVIGTSIGANGIDAGSLASSTWYSLWVIWNGTTTAGLMSLNATAPTLPAGYTHKARVGWIRTDSTANKYPLSFIQYGKKVSYKVSSSSNLMALPIPVSGAQGSISSPTWVAVAIGNYLPPTAVSIDLVLNSLGSYNSMAAPNNSYGAYNSASNPPPIVTLSAGSGVDVKKTSFILESTNFYYAASGGYCGISGWEDNL